MMVHDVIIMSHQKSFLINKPGLGYAGAGLVVRLHCNYQTYNSPTSCGGPAGQDLGSQGSIFQGGKELTIFMDVGGILPPYESFRKNFWLFKKIELYYNKFRCIAVYSAKFFIRSMNMINNKYK